MTITRPTPTEIAAAAARAVLHDASAHMDDVGAGGSSRSNAGSSVGPATSGAGRKSHKRTVGGGSKYVCNGCQTTFTALYILERHQRNTNLNCKLQSSNAPQIATAVTTTKTRTKRLKGSQSTTQHQATPDDNVQREIDQKRDAPLGTLAGLGGIRNVLHDVFEATSGLTIHVQKPQDSIQIAGGFVVKPVLVKMGLVSTENERIEFLPNSPRLTASKPITKSKTGHPCTHAEAALAEYARIYKKSGTFADGIRHAAECLFCAVSTSPWCCGACACAVTEMCGSNTKGESSIGLHFFAPQILGCNGKYFRPSTKGRSKEELANQFETYTKCKDPVCVQDTENGGAGLCPRANWFRQFKYNAATSASGICKNYAKTECEIQKARKFKLISFVPVRHQDQENDRTLLLKEESGLRRQDMAHSAKEVTEMCEGCKDPHIKWCPYFGMSTPHY
jgi:hypothetical protein